MAIDSTIDFTKSQNFMYSLFQLFVLVSNGACNVGYHNFDIGIKLFSYTKVLAVDVEVRFEYRFSWIKWAVACGIRANNVTAPFESTKTVMVVVSGEGGL
jgi:hypothetical protein